ncbi:hypothetical protein Vadar_008045 [Vaccinium darrowii]|uniref:Uncharacterized protein n=1 Tax=Vaccinium darrowii TaxID=229202 RepID=A0ACB7WZ71_9ERIC|nr:hypothetical protein Vadar_008045 [Vaccinium darrowii]
MNYQEEDISKRQMDSNKIEKEKRDHPELKRLGFVRIYAIKTLVCVSNLYEYAKHNSGSLKSAVGTVENAVAAVVGPVYENFKGVPDDLLVFLDAKVPQLCEVAQMAAPTMAHWSEKYNKTVEDLSAKGYTFFSVFPYIPIDGLAKAYKKIEAEKGPAYAAEEERHED